MKASQHPMGEGRIVTHDETAPSLVHLCCSGFVFDERGRVLFVLENYGQRRWGPPGGMIEAGESPARAVEREVLEETGLVVEADHLIALRYASGPPRGEWVSFNFRCEISGGSLALPVSGEIADVAWVDPDRPPLPLNESGRAVLWDAVMGHRGVIVGR